ncbi:MAG: hypothetical protein ACYS0I_04595 [Planctomycetota bacterium]|jgi:putative effector of murein hydrolase LrgA (UPF0299 family)
MNEEDKARLERKKKLAVFIVLVSFSGLLIYGLSSVGLGVPGSISGLLLLFGISGLFLYIEQLKNEIIDVLKDKGNNS